MVRRWGFERTGKSISSHWTSNRIKYLFDPMNYMVRGWGFEPQ